MAVRQAHRPNLKLDTLKLRFNILFVFCTVALMAVAQAGRDTYQFLNLPSSSRLASFGGANVSVNDGDLNMAFQNPALMSNATHNVLTLNYMYYISDINLASVAYGRTFGKDNHMLFGIQYIDYGKFLETSETDETLGTFTAKDFAMYVGYARTLPLGFTVAATCKPIYSVYERYHSFGVAFDIGAHYQNDSLGLSIGLALRNAGWQFTGYYSIDGKQHRETLPLDLELGISERFKHAPIRLSLTIHNMQRWNLGYERASSVLDAENTTDDVKWYDMMFRHTIWTVEILPTKNLFFAVSYNHRRRAEMSTKDWKTAAGFAFGAGLKIKMFNVGFSLVPYQVGNLSYHVTLGVNLAEFGVK